MKLLGSRPGLEGQVGQTHHPASGVGLGVGSVSSLGLALSL